MLAVALAVSIAFPALALEAPARKPAKKAAPRQVAHKKASPEQIRKFNELEKKRQRPKTQPQK